MAANTQLLQRSCIDEYPFTQKVQSAFQAVHAAVVLQIKQSVHLWAMCRQAAGKLCFADAAFLHGPIQSQFQHGLGRQSHGGQGQRFTLAHAGGKGFFQGIHSAHQCVVKIAKAYRQMPATAIVVFKNTAMACKPAFQFFGILKHNINVASGSVNAPVRHGAAS